MGALLREVGTDSPAKISVRDEESYLNPDAPYPFVEARAGIVAR